MTHDTWNMKEEQRSKGDEGGIFFYNLLFIPILNPDQTTKKDEEYHVLLPAGCKLLLPVMLRGLNARRLADTTRSTCTMSRIRVYALQQERNNYMPLIQ